MTELAMLGGSPRFPEGIPFVRPPAPALDRVVEILGSSWERGALTNGPLVAELERQTDALTAMTERLRAGEEELSRALQERRDIMETIPDLLYVLDPASASELEEARRLNDRLVARALAMGGTSTGEHGVGYGKMKFLEAEHGAALEVMRAIKRALDPDNRMNPGKMVIP